MRITSIIFLFVLFNSHAQTILNSESIMMNLDNSSILAIDIGGSVETGNVEIAEFNFTGQLGKKIDNSIFRLIIGYEYESESKEVLSQDYSAQIRYNYLIGDDSFFSFVQSQSVKSISMDHRKLFGLGFRKNIFKKNQNYFDLSLGLFYEDELYNEKIKPINIYNYRYSLSSFSNFSLSNNLRVSNTIYYQIKTNKSSDYRFFIEPKIYFEIDENKSFFLSTRNRYHSLPYMPVQKNDTETSVGIQIIF